jgi:hypothetical protein
MIETLKKIINCKICHQNLVEPVSLPCGETCCKKHQPNLGFGKLCPFCNKHHLLKFNESFPTNKVVQDLIVNKFAELDFGEDYKQAKQKVSELEQKIKDFAYMNDYPRDFVHEFFRKKRNQVDLTRETMIQAINEYSETLLAKIEANEKECINKVCFWNKKQHSFVNLTEIRSDLDRWQKELSYLKVDQKLWERIKQTQVRHLTTLEDARRKVENELIDCHSDKLQIDKKFSDAFSLFDRHVKSSLLET